MEYSKEILSFDEQVILQLRALYRKHGYSQYKMSRFEEYELYAGNKAFLPAGEILAFTGVGGKLMALRPDVTLSIVKYTDDEDELKKLYYNENVYRSDGMDFKEQMQVGVECLGKVDVSIMGEVLMLARQSLEVLGADSSLDVSHMGYLGGLLQSEGMTHSQCGEVVAMLREKNASGLKELCCKHGFSDEFCEKITVLSTIYGPYEEVADKLQRLSANEDMNAALQELDELHEVLCELGVRQGVNIDFSIVNDISYYSGVIFQGYIKGIPEKVIAGGRYDELLRKFGKTSGAIGFAVYLDVLEISQTGMAEMSGTVSGAEAESVSSAEMINIALPKGRLGESAYSIFEASGYGCPEIREESRKLVFESPENGVRFFWVKPSDVAKYVERGTADIGIVGKDILLEYTPEVYELLDLGIGKCSMCVAAQKGFKYNKSGKTLRVATKFPHIARGFYQKMGREIDVIKLNGSIELAPLLGLSDVIVDIVESGRTLLENDMEPTETIVDISARLISNKASYKFNHESIDRLCARIGEQL